MLCRQRFSLAIGLFAALFVAGCGGTRYASVQSSDGEPIMLIGHDPVAYFTMGKPLRGDPKIKIALPHRTYFFASEAHRNLFAVDPAKYEPQYGGFCSNGTPFKIKLGSDPTEWEIREGRLFIFGDIVGHSYWSLDPAFNVKHADQVWNEIKQVGWRTATFSAWTNKVPWYRRHKSLDDEWNAKHPDKPITYDPGGLVRNLLINIRVGELARALGNLPWAWSVPTPVRRLVQGRSLSRIGHLGSANPMLHGSVRCVVVVLITCALLSGCAVYNTSSDGADRDLMLLGHDPVSYFTATTPLKGETQWTARHRHGTYRFASAQNRARFLAAPESYVPQYGGFCAKGVSYAIRAGGDPLVYEIRHGRLFIFVNDYAREYWHTDPPDFIAKADHYWASELEDTPAKWTNLKRFVWRVPHYKSYPEEFSDYEKRTGKPAPVKK